MSFHCRGISSKFLANAQVVRNLGSGSFGRVDLLRDNTGQQYAVKYQNTEESAVNVGVNDSFLLEADSLTRLKNVPGIIQTNGFCLSDKSSAIILEPMDMDCRTFIGKLTPNQRIPMAINFLYEMIHALAFLELLNISHLDLKPDNILVRLAPDKPEFKITDFGLARPQISGHPSSEPAFTVWYRPPEFLAHRNRATFNFFAGDIWAIGLTALEMIVGRPVVYDMDESKNLDRIRMLANSPLPLPQFIQANTNGTITGQIDVSNFLRIRLDPPQWSQLNPDLVELISKMLILNPDQRPNSVSLLSNFYRIYIGADVISTFIPPVYDRRVNEAGIKRIISVAKNLKINVVVTITAIEIYTRFLGIASDRDYINLLFANTSLQIAVKFFNLPFSSNVLVSANEWNPLILRTIEKKILLSLDFKIYNIMLTSILKRASSKTNEYLDQIPTSRFGEPLSYWLT